MISPSKKKNLRLPKKDVVVRWNTSYDLLMSLLKIKDHCDERDIKIINNADWEFAKTFLKVFKPVKICTKQLQIEQLTPSDFFKFWTDATLRVLKTYKKLVKGMQHLI